MQISNNVSISGIDATRSPNRVNAGQPEADQGTSSGITAPNDQLDLSPEALSISTDSSGEVFRADRVAELRQAIAAGNYDNDERMTEALGRMLDRLG